MRGIILTIISLIGLYAQQGYPYKPKPILFIHGRSGSSETWGVKPEKPFIKKTFVWLTYIGEARYKNPSTDTILKDSIIPGHTYDRFLPLMIPYAKAWFSIDSSYTWDEAQPGYPNKSFLEVWNADYPLGSIDEEGSGGYFPSDVQVGWGKEIAQRIRRVLREYYGDNWQSDTSAKVVLVAHSMGSPSLRWAMVVDPEIRGHIAKIITIGGVHYGTPPVAPFPEGEIWVFWHLYWLPLGIGEDYKAFIPSYWRRPDKITLVELLLKVLLPSDLFLYLGDVLWVSPLQRFTDASADLGSGSGFQRNLNSDANLEKQEGPKYALIASNWPNPALIGLSVLVGGVQAAYYLAKFWDPGSVLLGLSKLMSIYAFNEWLFKSDFLVPRESALLEYNKRTGERIFPDAKRIWVTNLMHGDQPERFDLILRGLEEPPKIDTVYMSFPANGRIDTIILGLKEIDTIIANLDSVSIFFKLKDVYFLAQTKLSINLNGVNIGNLKYPDDKGFDGRWCRIPPEIIRYLGAGYNTLTITARNILGEQVSKTFKIWLVPAGWFVWNKFPEHRQVFNPQILSLSSDSFSLYIIKEGLDSAKLVIAWDSLYIIPAGLYQDTSGRFHFDTVEENIKGTFLSGA